MTEDPMGNPDPLKYEHYTTRMQDGVPIPCYREIKPAGTDPVQTLADKIASEVEWNPSVAVLRDEILRRFTERLDAICQKHPERLMDAIGIVIQAGPGRTVLILSDPSTKDIVAELQRYAEADLPSPLTQLLNAHLPI